MFVILYARHTVRTSYCTHVILYARHTVRTSCCTHVILYFARCTLSGVFFAVTPYAEFLIIKRYIKLLSVVVISNPSLGLVW